MDYNIEAKPQRMVFTVQQYEGAKEDMWKDIATFLRLLMKNEYVAVVYDDDLDVIVIDYGYNDESFGTPMPYWMTPNEHYEYVASKMPFNGEDLEGEEDEQT